MSEAAVVETDATAQHDAHAVFRGAVRKAKLPGGQDVWVIAGYDEVAALLADPRLSVDKRHSGGGYAGFTLPPALDRNLLNLDGPEHARIRRLAQPAFARRSMGALRALVDDIATDVLAGLPAAGHTDVLAALCVPVPASTIGQLLGVPADLHERLRGAANAMVSFDAASQQSALALFEAVGFLTATFGELVAAKRAAPADDLISGWVQARDDDGALSEDELVSLSFLMMMAGLENAVNLTGNVLRELLSAADRDALLADWPRHRQAVIERANPVPFSIRRFPVTDVTVGEAVLPAGETVLLSLFGADSDPARGDRPSLMFGRGAHYCLGAQAADAIVDAVVPPFFARYPNARLAVAPADIEYRRSWRSHAPAALPVELR